MFLGCWGSFTCPGSKLKEKRKDESNMNISETRSGDAIQIQIEGRVDTTTSPQLQGAILQAFQKGNKLVLDFSNVAYVSSAGLRALLIGQKTANSKGGSMTLTHVPEAVAQVFDMSGFSGILTIE